MTISVKIHGVEIENVNLLRAMARGDLVAVDRALAAGADPNARGGGYWRNACFVGVDKRGNPDCLRALIAAGADVNHRGDHGLTAAMAAADFGNLACLQMLIAAGADIEARDVFGGTALMRAAFRGEKSCVLALLEAGADIHALNCDGRDAAGVAARNEQPAIARLLEDVALAYAEQIELAGEYGHSRSNAAGGLELAGRKRAPRL